tara:strand:- start:185 stop:1198 length:1014 start_codon:yes stop_codon:yes gene_type:complete
MKFFQRLLVAPAALGLLAPVAVNADTAFSSTTTMSGGAFFTTGSVDAGTGTANEELYMQYAYGLDLDSSFTGKDLLKVGIIAGNATGPLASMDSAEATSSALNVGSLYYSFPLGDLALTAGPLVDQDDIVAATVSKYSDGFRLGAMPYSLAGNETGPGVGATYATDSGWVISASFVADDGADSSLGINADTGNDVTTFTLGYNTNIWGGGIVLANNDGDSTANTNGYDALGGGIYFSPESLPATFSVTYDTKDPETGNDETDFFIGFDYEVGPGTLHAAWNTTEVDGGSDNLDISGFEVSYSYSVNDGVTITPGFFTIDDGEGEEDTGFVVETAFSF